MIVPGIILHISHLSIKIAELRETIATQQDAINSFMREDMGVEDPIDLQLQLATYVQDNIKVYPADYYDVVTNLERRIHYALSVLETTFDKGTMNYIQFLLSKCDSVVKNERELAAYEKQLNVLIQNQAGWTMSKMLDGT
jgi:hypothetical protein